MKPIVFYLSVNSCYVVYHCKILFVSFILLFCLCSCSVLFLVTMLQKKKKKEEEEVFHASRVKDSLLVLMAS
jgi:hypothetical protein